MNKITAIMLALAAILFAAGPAMAEIDSASDSTSEANATINTSTIDNSRNLPQILTPTKLDGSFITTPQLYYDPRLGDSIPEDALPEIYRIEGWKIFYSAPYNNGAKVGRVKSERKAWISNQESATGERVLSDAKATEDDDILTPLPYYPEGANEVSISKVFLDKEKYIVNQAVSEAWYHAWQKSAGAKYYVILYNSRLVSQANVKALGSALVSGASVDPQSINNTSVNALSAGGGVGFGTARAHIFKEPSFMVIAFSNKGEIPKRLLKKPEPPKELSVKQEEMKVEIKEEIVFPVVEFELNKFKLITEKQRKPVRLAAKEAAKNWDKMKKEGLYIMIVGSCSPEGTANYNDVLGRKRAEEIYKLFSTILIDVYGLPDEEVKERVKFLSAGKNNYPEFEEITKQRNAAFFVAAKLKIKKE